MSRRQTGLSEHHLPPEELETGIWLLSSLRSGASAGRNRHQLSRPSEQVLWTGRQFRSTGPGPLNRFARGNRRPPRLRAFSSGDRRSATGRDSGSRTSELSERTSNEPGSPFRTRTRLRLASSSTNRSVRLLDNADGAKSLQRRFKFGGRTGDSDGYCLWLQEISSCSLNIRRDHRVDSIGKGDQVVSSEPVGLDVQNRIYRSIGSLQLVGHCCDHLGLQRVDLLGRNLVLL